MNLAFPALCILLISLPGVFFRKGFARASLPAGSGKRRITRHVANKYPVSIRPIVEEVSLSLAWTIVLHVVWLSLATFLDWGLTGEEYQKVVRVLHGSNNVADQAYRESLNYIADSRMGIVVYFLSLYSFSFMAGRVSLYLVRYWHLDHRFHLLRLEDQWFYFLRGEIFNFAEFKGFLPRPRPQICGTYVSVVINQTGVDYLYKGFLWDFHLDSSGNLDRLVLHHTIRSRFDPDPKKDPHSSPKPETPALESEANRIETAPLIVDGAFAFQTVTSQLFTVRYSDCKTLSCTYFYIRKPRFPSGQGRENVRQDDQSMAKAI